jgi:hypothetical protein
MAGSNQSTGNDRRFLAHQPAPGYLHGLTWPLWLLLAQSVGQYPAMRMLFAWLIRMAYSHGLFAWPIRMAYSHGLSAGRRWAIWPLGMAYSDGFFFARTIRIAYLHGLFPRVIYMAYAHGL